MKMLQFATWVINVSKAKSIFMQLYVNSNLQRNVNCSITLSMQI